MRLQNKILLLLVPLVILPILVLGWTSYTLLMEDARDRTHDQVTTLLEQVRFHTEAQLQTARANASLFAHTELVKGYVTTTSASVRAELEPGVQELLYNYQLAYPEYYEIRIISPAGEEMLRSVVGNVNNLKHDESSSGYFRAMSDSSNAIYTTFLNNPDNNQPILLTSKPLRYIVGNSRNRNAKTRLYGYLVLTVDLDFLATQAENMKAGRHGDVFFTDSAGKILFHPDQSKVGGRLKNNLFAKLTDSTQSTDSVDALYRNISAHYQGIKLHDWLYAVAVYQESEFKDRSFSLGRLVTLIASVAILLTIALLFGFLKKVLITPILKLGQAADEIGHGNLLVPIDVDTDDEVGQLATSFKEMGENLNHYHEQVRYVAYHDSLTGLPNRLMFKDYLGRATAEARRNLQELSILFIDLDNFKRINDTLGHQAGDTLLEAFAQRLTTCLRETDVISHEEHDTTSNVMARLAGDEFTIMLPRTKGASASQKVARRILELLTEPFTINRQELFVSASVGIALFPNDGVSVDELMKNADIAMYHAKKSGRNNYQYFSGKLNKEALFKVKIESKLRHALDKDELEVYYQPQMAFSSGRIIGAEALLRWKDEELGMISPEVFIPIAEEYGLIVAITEWVIHSVCKQAQQWKERYKNPLTMAVNISAVHFCGNGLEELVSRTLDATGYDPQFLEIELTETSVLQDPGMAISTLRNIQEMGLQTSLDDFGTGYSSLNYLMQLPLNKLKIDRSFVVNMDVSVDENENDKGKGTAIVAAIIAMAHSLDLEVIAEGVEEVAQLQLLRKLKCDIVQGYYIARPMPASEFEQLVTSGDMENIA
jgi:diguanylate cyclase (GGDEF)-like protein